MLEMSANPIQYLIGYLYILHNYKMTCPDQSYLLNKKKYLYNFQNKYKMSNPDQTTFTNVRLVEILFVINSHPFFILQVRVEISSAKLSPMKKKTGA